MIILDIESSGLDPTSDVMLELGMLHVTDDLTSVLGEFSTLIGWDGNLDLVGTIVLEMHTKSGLWDALVEAGDKAPSTARAEQDAIRWLEAQENQFGIEIANEPMVGSTIGFDRGFLKVHMRELESYWHYRSIDASSVKELVRRWRPAVYAMLPEGRKTHRALPDCYDTLNELRFYKTRVLDYLTSPYFPIAGPT